MLGRIGGRWLLTYWDHPHIRQLYSVYTMRMGFCKHMLIMNYQPSCKELLKEFEPLLLFDSS
ncbi:MAG: hypothetical protein ACUVTM_06420 [Candidatus Bathyarchaeia archaeon]